MLTSEQWDILVGMISEPYVGSDREMPLIISAIQDNLIKLETTNSDKDTFRLRITEKGKDEIVEFINTLTKIPLRFSVIEWEQIAFGLEVLEDDSNGSIGWFAGRIRRAILDAI